MSGTLDSVTLWLSQPEPSAVGTMYVDLYGVTGDYGTTSVPMGLPLATSDPVDVHTAYLVDPEFYPAITFRFDNTALLQAGAHYVVAVRYEAAPGVASVNLAFTADPHPGNPAAEKALVGWLPAQDAYPYDYDIAFAVFVEPSQTVSTPASSSWSLVPLGVFGVVGVLMMRRRVSA